MDNESFKREALLDSFDGVEDFQHLLNDEGPQVVKPLNGFPHKLQHISGSGLIAVVEELHQLRTM